MLANQSGADWTARMEVFAARRVEELARPELCGYVRESRSPSCGTRSDFSAYRESR